MKRGLLAFFSLLLLLPNLVGCSWMGIESVQSRKLPSPDQVAPSQAITEARPMDPYVLEIGDEVNIKVWGFENNTMDRTSVVINNSGEIYYPFIGAVKLAGQTVPKAQELLVTRLKKYIVDPQVELTSSTNRQQVFVLGEVNSAGSVTYRRPLLVSEAIAKAGWFNKDANRKSVVLVRRADNKFNVFSVNTGDIFRDGSKIPEIYLQGGDMVYVPPMGVVKLERFLQHIQNIAQPFLTIEQAVVLWPQFFDVLTGKTTSATGLSIGTTQPQ
jgi:polysaccharide biosynthesis/export protein